MNDAMNRADAYRNIPWLHLRCGDTVHREDDPCHLGRVVAIFHSIDVKVRWENGWIERVSAHELIKERNR